MKLNSNLNLFKNNCNLGCDLLLSASLDECGWICVTLKYFHWITGNECGKLNQKHLSITYGFELLPV